MTEGQQAIYKAKFKTLMAEMLYVVAKGAAAGATEGYK